MKTLGIALVLACLATPLVAGAPDQAPTTGKAATAAKAQPAPLPLQKLPTIADMYGMLDLKDPYRSPISGLFSESATVDTKQREFFVYIGAKNRQSEPFVILVPDSKQPNPSDLLVKSGWKDIADADGLIVAIAKPTGSPWSSEADLAYLKAISSEAHSRHHYNVQRGHDFLIAYGDSATVAQKWAMAEPGSFAAIATLGDIATIDPKFIAQTESGTTRLASVSASDIPLPVWFFVSGLDANAKAVLDTWNKRNKVDSEKFSTGMATGVYMPKTGSIDSLINEQNFLAQTRYTVTPAPAAVDVARTKAIWRFMSPIERPAGFANNALRSSRTVEQWGATKRNIDVNGVTRYWVEFVPRQVFNTTPGKVPLVVYFHGNNNTAESMLGRSELIKVANDRGFVAIMMTGALYHDTAQAPNPYWNLAEDPKAFDDYAYVRAAIQDVVKRLPVDTTRIYAMGQSYGSAATLAFGLRMNDVFAAGAGTGLFLFNQLLPLYDSDKVLKGNLMPINVLLGTEDMGGGTLQNASFRVNYPHWLERNGLVTDIDKAITGTYRSGRFTVYDFANAKGVPLVEYVLVDERVHTIVPMDLYFQYDTFVSKWSRGSDGTLYYLGKPVQK